MFGFLDLYTILMTIHVFGAILGAGGAFASDSMFLSSVKNGQISQTEMRFLRLGSHLVWTGLAFLIISGLLLFSLNSGDYLTSNKFLAKMSIVGLILINGVVFHTLHLPLLQRNLDAPFASSPEFIKRSSLILASGVISMISWITTVILGMLKFVPYSYGIIMGIYLLLLVVGITTSLSLKKRILHL